MRRTRCRTSQNARSGIMGLLRAEQNVGNLEQRIFGNYGAPVRGAKRRKSQKMTFNNSGTPVRRTRRRKSQKNELSGILGLLCAEKIVGNLLKNARSGILGLLCAEQDVGIRKK